MRKRGRRSRRRRDSVNESNKTQILRHAIGREVKRERD